MVSQERKVNNFLFINKFLIIQIVLEITIKENLKCYPKQEIHTTFQF